MPKNRIMATVSDLLRGDLLFDDWEVSVTKPEPKQGIVYQNLTLRLEI